MHQEVRRFGPWARTALRMVTRGASDYFALPDDLEILRNGVAAAVERYDEVERSSAQQPREERAAVFEGIVGERGP